MAKSKTYHALGLMCGSSMDGMDMAYCRFQKVNGVWNWELLSAATAPYSKLNLKRLKKLSGYTLIRFRYAEIFFTIDQVIAVEDFMESKKLKKPDFVSWHGHTVFHDTQMNITCQCGSGPVMSDLFDIPVITNLRTQDMMLAGKGAPIVPIADKHLFRGYQLWLNLGGIANISVNVRGKMIAFDICPLNQVLNHFAAKKKLAFDDGGQLAAKGKVDKGLLQKWMKMDFFKEPYPKSLDNTYTDEVLAAVSKGVSIPDALATYCELAAKQIATHIQKVERKGKVSLSGKKMLVTGGGTFNTYLMQRIAHYTKVKVVVPDANTVNFKEAIAMAFIGVLRMENTPNVLASATGASRDSVNGTISYPSDWT